MDEQPPAPDQPSSPTPYEAGTAAYEPVTPASRASRARVTALVLAVLVVLTGGGTVLLLRASNSTQSLDQFVPDTVAAYVKFSIQPSVEQKQKVQDLLSRFPPSVSSNVGSKLDDALEKALKDLKVSYKNDVKPWVGSQIVIAVLAPSGSSDTGSAVPNVIGIASVKDAAAAQKALTKIKSSQSKAPAFLIEGGVAYLGQTQNSITSFKDAVTRGHTLADSANYKREHARAGGDGLVFAYADLSKVAGLSPGLRGDVLGGAPFTGGSGIVSFALRAETQGIALAGHSSLPATATGAKGGTLKILPTTPDDVLGTLSFFDLGDLVGNLLKTLNKGFGLQPAAVRGPQVPGLSEATSVLKEVEKALGLNLQRDLLPWLKGELSIVVGPVTNPPIPNIGILIEPTDKASLARTMSALRTHLGALLGSNGKVQSDANGLTIKTPVADIAIRQGAGRLVIASSVQYAQRLLNPSGATLGNDTVYKASVDPFKPTVFQLFVRLDRVRTLVEGFLKLSNPNEYSSYEQKTQPFLKPLQALGIQSTIDGNSQDFSLILTIAKP